MFRMQTVAALWLGLAAPLLADGKPVTFTVRSAGSGRWSDAATWEPGRVPRAGDLVQVRPGHAVVYDANSDQAIRLLHVAGKLTFRPDVSTRLDAGLIKVQPGEECSEEGFDCDLHQEAAPALNRASAAVLEVGTAEQPILAGNQALIRLVYFEGADRQSNPAIVCCGGRMEFHGAPLEQTWVKLGATARKGDARVVLAQGVGGWRAGDRVIVTATQTGVPGSRLGYENFTSFTEERLITGISSEGGQTVLTLDAALLHEHVADGACRGEVANLTRNVVVESANPNGVRGHTMFHRGSAGNLKYAEFRHLGKQGVLGRYSLHYHLVGNSMRGSSVVGCSIWESQNRWLTIHGTNHLVVRDNVGYKSAGHGFFLEDGTEVYNVLDRNLAVGARMARKLPKQVLPFDQNEGAGFWWANSRNTFTRNVAADCGEYGFRYEATETSELKLDLPVLQPDGQHRVVDIRTLPFIRFEANEAHSMAGHYGFNLGEGVERAGPDPRHPFMVRNTRIWNVHYGFRPQVPCLLVEEMQIHDVAYGVYHPNYENHVYRNLLISRAITEPFNRGHDDLSVQYGVLTVDGLTFDDCQSGYAGLIQISEDNPTGHAASHFRNVRTLNWRAPSRQVQGLVNRGGGPREAPTTAKGVPVYLHDWYAPGRHALVVSTASAEYRARMARFRAEPPLTGDESRAAEVGEVSFPELLDPVDDLPPGTVVLSITAHQAPAGTRGKVVVRGIAHDNSQIAAVIVNGQSASLVATSAGLVDWQIVLPEPPDGQISAHAIDAHGNEERMVHRVSLAR